MAISTTSTVGRKTMGSAVFAGTKRLVFAGSIVSGALLSAACGGEPTEGEPLGVAVLGTGGYGGNGSNEIPAAAIADEPLRRSNTDAYGITTTSNADLAPLCATGTITSSGCTLSTPWHDWRFGEMGGSTHRSSMLKAVVKCAFESSFTVTDGLTDGGAPASWAGSNFSMFESFKDTALGSSDREMLSACVLALINAHGDPRDICLVSAEHGSPPCESTFTTMESGIFGDLFASDPVAYVTGGIESTHQHPAYRIKRTCESNTVCQGFTTLGHIGTICSGGFSGPTGFHYCTEFDPGGSTTYRGFTVYRNEQPALWDP